MLSCSRELKEADQATDPKGGRCYINKGSSNYLCLDFNEGFDANTANSTCMTEYNRYKNGASGWDIDWLVGDFNTCDTSGSVGACTRSDGILYYFSKYGTAASAESDCVSTHTGIWSAT